MTALQISVRKKKLHWQTENKFTACNYRNSIINRATNVGCARKEELRRRIGKSLWDMVTYIFQRKTQVGQHPQEGMFILRAVESQMRIFILRTPGLDTYQETFCAAGKMDVKNQDNKMPWGGGAFHGKHDLQGH